MNLFQLRGWLSDSLKEATPLDRPSSMGDPNGVADKAAKKLALLGYGSDELLSRACQVRTAQECAEILADCIAALPTAEDLPTPNRAMSVVEVAEVLGVSKETVYRLCSERRMPHDRISRRIAITPEQLAEYLGR